MHKFTRIILALTVLPLLVVSCGDGLNVRQGSWLKYRQPYWENDVLAHRTMRIRVASCEYSEGIGDEIMLRVNYALENSGSSALRVSWEDAYVEDQSGALYDAFDGSSAADAAPGETLSGLYSRHRIPKSSLRDGGIDKLNWGKEATDEAGLAFRVRLKPVAIQ